MPCFFQHTHTLPRFRAIPLPLSLAHTHTITPTHTRASTHEHGRARTPTHTDIICSHKSCLSAGRDCRRTASDRRTKTSPSYDESRRCFAHGALSCQREQCRCPSKALGIVCIAYIRRAAARARQRQAEVIRHVHVLASMTSRRPSLYNGRACPAHGTLRFQSEQRGWQSKHTGSSVQRVWWTHSL